MGYRSRDLGRRKSRNARAFISVAVNIFVLNGVFAAVINPQSA
jgi:hypothetical protein